MPITNIKPINCTCDFPKVIARNYVGHAITCPVYHDWWDNAKKLQEIEFEKQRQESKRLMYGYSDNVE